MRIRTLATICLMICMTVFVFLSSASAQIPGMPPHIERIINKAQSGENITAQEQDALEKWGKSMEGAQGAGVSGTLPAGEPAGEPGTEGITWPEKVKIKDLQSKAPTREAYLGVLKEINQVYGEVYAPTLNEILNVHRELLVLSAQRNILGMGNASIS